MTVTDNNYCQAAVYYTIPGLFNPRGIMFDDYVLKNITISALREYYVE